MSRLVYILHYTCNRPTQYKLCSRRARNMQFCAYGYILSKNSHLEAMFAVPVAPRVAYSAKLGR